MKTEHPDSATPAPMTAHQNRRNERGRGMVSLGDRMVRIIS
ncbi:hypothetical protein SXCC_03907 [Gluconacetobacter sp. SXCC-1]|nr:hypothetical protein SXCC_03907 [Gluconacetobacter sp. SXCC-1]